MTILTTTTSFLNFLSLLSAMYLYLYWVYMSLFWFLFSRHEEIQRLNQSPYNALTFAAASLSPVTLSTSSEILIHCLPSTSPSLMTMFSALLFSSGLDAFRKSFVSEVPMPKPPVKGAILTKHRDRHDRRTREAFLIALFLEFEYFVDVQ